MIEYKTMGSTTVKGMATILLATKSVKRAIIFYHELLGLPIVHQDAGIVQFDCGNVLLTLQQHDADHEVAPHPNHMSLVIDVDDVDGLFYLLKRARVTILELPKDQPWGDRAGVIRDPDGYTLELSQCMHEEKQEHGYAEA